MAREAKAAAADASQKITGGGQAAGIGGDGAVIRRVGKGQHTAHSQPLRAVEVGDGVDAPLWGNSDAAEAVKRLVIGLKDAVLQQRR